MIKAIIFDFDGVLVESMDIKARAFAFLFKAYPGQVEEIVKFHLRHGGMPRYEKFERIYEDILHEPLSEEKKKMLGEQFSRFVYQEVVSCPFVKGAREYLDKGHERMLFFVVSGTPDGEIKAIVKERGLERYFVEVLGSPLKKAAHNIAILKRHGLRPEEAIFVGDSIDDWEGVQGTGIKFIGREIGQGTFTGLKVSGLIKDLSELERVVNDAKL